MNTDLIIVGAGAAGLMAGAVAGEAGIAAVVLERRHRAGLKLLLCGNNRCNISHGGTQRAWDPDSEPIWPRPTATPSVLSCATP